MPDVRKRRGRPGLSLAQATAVRKHLLALLKSCGGNASTLADLLNLSPSAISQIRTRKNRASISTAAAIGKALGIPLVAVLGEPSA